MIYFHFYQCEVGKWKGKGREGKELKGSNSLFDTNSFKYWRDFKGNAIPIIPFPFLYDCCQALLTIFIYPTNCVANLCIVIHHVFSFGPT